MVFSCFMEVAWVAYLSFGPLATKLLEIIDIHQNRALVNGTFTQCPPEVCLTNLAATRWANKIKAREKQAKVTGFDHYRVMT
ncbi:hypothetical protein QTO34_019262, partial [Cnephaeus nilssonii]